MKSIHSQIESTEKVLDDKIIFEQEFNGRGLWVNLSGDWVRFDCSFFDRVTASNEGWLSLAYAEFKTLQSLTNISY